MHIHGGVKTNTTFVGATLIVVLDTEGLERFGMSIIHHDGEVCRVNVVRGEKLLDI